MRILVGICTYSRPDGLAKLLDRLTHIDVPVGATLVDVLVMDDDPGGSAQALCDDHTFRHGTLHYRRVGSRNLSRARNAVLRFADGYDVLAMIDDDEFPARSWLTELVRVAEQFDLDLVIGPVVARSAGAIPSWAADMFTIRSGHTDGQRLHEGISGNALLCVEPVRRTGIEFTTALGRAGGEDQVFFRRLDVAGLRIGYAARAEVWESVPADRMTMRYLLTRSFRVGNTLGLIDSRYLRTPSTIVRRTVKAVGWTTRGMIHLVGCLPLLASDRGRSGAARAVLSMARGVGMGAGLLGLRLDMYGERVGLRSWRRDQPT